MSDHTPDLRAFGIHEPSQELDRLRDLRALVLRTAETGPWGADGAASLGRWLEIVNAARGAMTAATFDPSRPA